MEGFTDIHTHILPGVDDGAHDLSQALNLTRMANKDGTAAIFLTSHYRGRYRRNSPAWLRETADMFRQAVDENGLEVELYLGSEVHYEDGVMDKILRGEILTMNDSDYILLEFSAASLSSAVRTGVDAAVNAGLVPIIAHAERYDCFRKNKALAEEVCGMGALIQLNADSILGKHGLGVKLLCGRLLKEQLVSFVASDAHDASERSPLMYRCYQQVLKKYGKDYAAQLFWKNGRAVIENRMI